MILYFVRHAIAQDAQSWGKGDETRPLTAEGVKKMREVAAGLAKVVEGFDEICCSPLVRARQTAEVLTQQFKHKKDLVIWKELIPGTEPAELQNKVNRLKADTVALVGHEPHLGYSVSYFLSGKQDTVQIDFKKAAVCCIEFNGSIPATLLWFIPPKVARAMVRRSRHL
ncbi:MAG TPA: phosphohistidine phosphatase SixA [Acidobacteriota bacterium]|jgi:phosphohistidine phosphatase|nr:phosphohistidine phosphatase SixA [Acidobacteriota bacterium]